ncbi:MAG TPA: hypothetical protein VKU41_20040 [Polyangiaceae bacterium]|nr:hypothetical protein [Polyangiaceae bacterium]
MTRGIVTITTAVAAIALTSPAFAQTLLLSGEVGLASGVEGGDPGTGSTTFRRARTRFEAGGDLRSDEDRVDAFALRAFAEIEPHVSVGGELRYVRYIGQHFTGFAGFTGTLAPHTLFGGVVGVQGFIPLGKTLSLLIEPSFSALPFGSDLPTDQPLLWGLLCVGIRGDFLAASAANEEGPK